MYYGRGTVVTRAQMTIGQPAVGGREITSWPPSWTHDVMRIYLKITTAKLHPIRFEMTER